MSSAPPAVYPIIYFGTLGGGQDDADEVSFSPPARLRRLRLVPAGASPHPSLPNFQGATSQGSFVLDLFARDLANPSHSRFKRLAPPIAYQESSGGSGHVYDLDVTVTDSLVIRGAYRNVSIVVYGERFECPALAEGEGGSGAGQAAEDAAQDARGGEGPRPAKGADAGPLLALHPSGSRRRRQLPQWAVAALSRAERVWRRLTYSEMRTKGVPE